MVDQISQAERDANETLATANVRADQLKRDLAAAIQDLAVQRSLIDRTLQAKCDADESLRTANIRLEQLLELEEKVQQLQHRLLDLEKAASEREEEMEVEICRQAEEHHREVEQLRRERDMVRLEELPELEVKIQQLQHRLLDVENLAREREEDFKVESRAKAEEHDRDLEQLRQKRDVVSLEQLPELVGKMQRLELQLVDLRKAATEREEEIKDQHRATAEEHGREVKRLRKKRDSAKAEIVDFVGYQGLTP